jgi:predicted metal-dependent phosphoesterase TrpH
MKKGIETLHAHTRSSDGELTHLETLNACKKYGISVVAFTDHDTVPDKKVIRVLRQNMNHETKWIIGVEISSNLPKELGGKSVSNFHIVGLFVDPTNSKLVDYCKKAKEARIERLLMMVKNLKRLGFDISADDCLRLSGREAVGRPHIAAALLKKEKNLKIIEQLTEEMKKAAKTDKRVKEEYEKMIDLGKEEYVYYLLLSKNAFVKGVYVDYLFGLDMDSVVSIIRNAGGVAIIAHPFFCMEYIDLETLSEFFKDGRVDGAETVFGLDLYGSSLFNSIEKNRKEIKCLVKRFGVLESGGMDAHSEEHLSMFGSFKLRPYAEETIGMAERIVKQSGVSREWCSL